MEALENIDESELTASELSYYIGVMSRIQQMVLAVGIRYLDDSHIRIRYQDIFV